MMAPSTFKRAGLEKLSPQEMATLNELLAGFTATVLEYANKQNGSNSGTPSSSFYPSVGRGQWVRSKSNGGRIVTLEDGSTWEINSIDHIYSALWLPLTSVAVVENDYPIGRYRYLLVNTDDGENAQARFLAKQ